VFAERFRQRVGVTPGGYLLQVRMARASTLLRDERSTLRTVAAAVGYGSEASFAAAFKRYTGTTPGAHGRGLVEGFAIDR
jgi:AraC-like DNA-binding protein